MKIICLIFFSCFLNFFSFCFSISRESWCSEICQLEEYKILCENNWIFILSSGRAGSTTILQALNFISNINLIGETNIINELNSLYNIYSSSSSSPTITTTAQNILFLKELQSFYYILNCPNGCKKEDILGGKEVHFTIKNIYFLKLLFPCSRFIFNFRNDTKAQGNSAYHKRQQTSPIFLKKFNSQLLYLHKLWKDRSFLMIMEDFSIKQFNNLLLWLDIKDCSFKTIGHFNQNNTYHLSTKPQLLGKC